MITRYINRRGGLLNRSPYDGEYANTPFLSANGGVIMGGADWVNVVVGRDSDGLGYWSAVKIVARGHYAYQNMKSNQGDGQATCIGVFTRRNYITFRPQWHFIQNADPEAVVSFDVYAYQSAGVTQGGCGAKKIYIGLSGGLDGDGGTLDYEYETVRVCTRPDIPALVAQVTYYPSESRITLDTSVAKQVSEDNLCEDLCDGYIEEPDEPPVVIRYNPVQVYPARFAEYGNYYVFTEKKITNTSTPENLGNVYKNALKVDAPELATPSEKELYSTENQYAGASANKAFIESTRCGFTRKSLDGSTVRYGLCVGNSTRILMYKTGNTKTLRSYDGSEYYNVSYTEMASQDGQYTGWIYSRFFKDGEDYGGAGALRTEPMARAATEQDVDLMYAENVGDIIHDLGEYIIGVEGPYDAQYCVYFEVDGKVYDANRGDGNVYYVFEPVYDDDIEGYFE